jgi:hypothetical protein
MRQRHHRHGAQRRAPFLPLRRRPRPRGFSRWRWRCVCHGPWSLRADQGRPTRCRQKGVLRHRGRIAADRIARMSCTPSLFHHLRSARAFTAWVLAWWTLSLAAAVITPALAASPTDADLHQVCSVLGVQPPAEPHHPASGQPSGSGWHCVLCLGGGAPLAAAPTALAPGEIARPGARAAATPAPYSRHAGPAPARGPPAA